MTRPDITLEGWQTEPQLRWSFQHVAELFPTARIPAAATPSPLDAAPADLGAIPVTNPLTGVATSVREIIDTTFTDGWAVAHGGHVLHEEYFGSMTRSTRHLLMSVSKSLVGVVAGALADQGSLDPAAEVTRYVPSLAESGYAGATVRDLLDMRSGVRFSEEYLNPDAEVRLLEQAIGWAPRRTPDVPHTLCGFLLTLQQEVAHGSRFSYRSAETDVLGWVCEQAAGRRMPELLGDLLWRPIGAEFDADLAIDSEGTGMFDGGISAGLRDLVRFGSIFLDDGVAWSGERVLSPGWVEETVTGGPDSRAAFAAGEDALWMPGGKYRNQLWFPTAREDLLLCLGIHGQMIYVDRSAGLVAVKLSSWPTPQDAVKLMATIAAFDAIVLALA